MRVRVATTVLGLTAVTVLALPACSTPSSQTKPAASSATRTGIPVNGEQQTAPLSSAALERLLLDESDLGSGYTRTPQRPAQHDDVSVLGCPTLAKLGADTVTGSSLDFPREAKASFTYSGDSNSGVSEELYSDSAGKLSDSTGRIFAAITGCPEFQLLSGSTAVDITTQRMSAPQLGDERWSMLLTFSADGRDSVVKQTAIRSGNVLLTVSGAPALVDKHLDKALAKVTASR
ncbi:hypothetical protein AB0D86_43110 [Streptomyces sp. NPDC048324]|uniref:hypothetical protein n=1 Tax=Streptomyces sp. NPDC048324 TaxID=3157205 RepID=UPI00343FE13E